MASNQNQKMLPRLQASIEATSTNVRGGLGRRFESLNLALLLALFAFQPNSIDQFHNVVLSRAYAWTTVFGAFDGYVAAPLGFRIRGASLL
jgi:hypothetical protein